MEYSSVTVTQDGRSVEVPSREEMHDELEAAGKTVGAITSWAIFLFVLFGIVLIGMNSRIKVLEQKNNA